MSSCSYKIWFSFYQAFLSQIVYDYKVYPFRELTNISLSLSLSLSRFYKRPITNNIYFPVSNERSLI